MNDPRHHITSAQLMAFIVSAQIGIGILSLPSILAQKIGHDGWIPTLISGIGGLAVIIVIMLLLKRYVNKTIFEINISLYGRIFGFILNICFVFYLLFITGITTRVFVEVINIISLKYTPPLVITVLILIPTIYGISKGLKVICRFACLLFIAYFILLLTILLVIDDLRFTYIMPIGKAGLIPIVKSMKYNIYSYLGFELVTLIYPNIKNKEKATKFMVISIIFTTLYYTIVVLVSTMLFGEVKLSMLLFPVYNIEQVIEVPIIERLDTVYILFWFPTMAAAIRAYFFTSCYSISMLFNIKRNKMLIFVILIIEIIISRIPKDFEAMQRYTNYSGDFGITIISIIIITFLISLFRKKGANLD